MKILLTILCAIMVLFGGGCALLLAGGNGIGNLFQALPFAFIPGGIAALNVAVLAALWGFAKPSPGVFIILVILDGLVVLAVLLAWASMGLADSELNMLAGLTAAAFAAKGLLNFAMLKEAGSRTEPNDKPGNLP